jgi:hypothetical protein
MTEKDYIIATNLAKARMAATIVREILPGFDGVTTEEEITTVARILWDWSDRLHKIISDDMG